MHILRSLRISVTRSIRGAGPFIFPVWLGLLLMPACKRSELRGPLEHDDTAPGVVSNISVEPLHGGAKISYVLPESLDLLYVQADYEIRPGVKEMAVASFYDNSLVVQGFGDTSEHEVEIYTVDRSGNKSDPEMVTIQPLISPVQQTYDSLSYESDFGGAHVTFKNEAKADIVISVMIKNATGDWVDYDKEYTSLPDGDFSVRGLPAEPTTFGIFVRDRWDNHSDTLVKNLTPLFETQLDKSKFREVDLPTDAVSIWNFPGLWNDRITKNNGDPGFRSEESKGFPCWFTFDLGIKSKISRLRIWQVHDGREYSSSNVKQFQVWGSNAPNPDGSWEGWTLLQDCEIVKPSGLPEGELSNEDRETAAAGDEFSIPPAAPAVRYIRIKLLSTFASPPGSPTGGSWITEMTFWGQEQP